MARTNVVRFERKHKRRSAAKLAQRTPAPADRAMVELVALLNKRKPNLSELCEKSGVSRSCIRKWQLGETRRPQGATMDFVARQIGYHRPWTKA